MADADECLACAGPITRTGSLPASDPDDGPVPVGFCEHCRTIQTRRNGVWLPVGRPRQPPSRA